jgi:hypothetical protein
MINRSIVLSTTHRHQSPLAGWSLLPQPSDPGPGPSITETPTPEEEIQSGEGGSEINPVTEAESALPVPGSKPN